MINLKKKFFFNNPDIENAFIDNGFVIIKDAFEKKIINDLYNFFLSNYKKLTKLSKQKKIPLDYELWSIAIMDLLEKESLYKDYVKSPKLIHLLKLFLGPDICTLGYNSLWINNPSNKNPVINKSAHVDAWTGTGINTLFFKVFLTDVDRYNGLTVYPKSHLQGMIPVKSRKINQDDFDIKFQPLNLINIKKGDAVLWHSLLLHSTTGQSNKNIRVSMTARFTSSENDFSSQERALGYQALNIGPLNKIKRVIGNDYLFPLRTYNTFIGTDKRLTELYKNEKNKNLEKIKRVL